MLRLVVRPVCDCSLVIEQRIELWESIPQEHTHDAPGNLVILFVDATCRDWHRSDLLCLV